MKSKFFPWIVVAFVCAGASVRIGISLASPVFTEFDPISLFRSDPALLYYITERIIDNGGWPPSDFRADPRIEHLETSDIPAMFTVGLEFLVAWVYLLFGKGMPFHLFALVLTSIIASTTVVGVVGLTRELLGSKAWASLAGLIYLITPASYRTVGIILIREDLSFPLFAIHLYLLARALRVRSTGAIVAAAVTAIAALATWHAMSFIFTLEVACVFAWYLRTGENPMRVRESWAALAIFVAGGLLIPVLFSKLFLFSLPVQMLCVMSAMPYLERRSSSGDLRRVIVALLCLVFVGVVCTLATDWLAPGSKDYSHVVEMMLAKVLYLGAKPRDPLALSFGARLLWDGVFATSTPQLVLSWLGVLAFLTSVSAVAGIGSWWRGRGDGRELTLVAFGAIALFLALLVGRLFALAAILSPTLAVLLLRSSFTGQARRSWIAALLVVQGVLAAGMLDNSMLKGWYNPAYLRQLAGTLHYIKDELPEDGAIASDFVLASALLAQTTHPSVLQPKYETQRSRDRIQHFTIGLYHSSPVGFREILRRDFDARYLLVDVRFLLKHRYKAGIPVTSDPPLRSAAASLLSSDANVYRMIPGYRFLYESQPNGLFRLYELADLDEPD